jgi:hypothetical protein
MQDMIKVVLHTPSEERIIKLFEAKLIGFSEGFTYNLILEKDVRMTLVAVVDREEFRVGLSICNTKHDNFNKKLGIANATMRALTNETIYLERFYAQPTKQEVLNKLKELHTQVGMNLKDYKRMLHGVQ